MRNEYIKGVVEGFYGRPWKWTEREDVLTFMKGKYNLYIYAPKEDKLHRDLWREDYPEEFMERFGNLVNYGKTAAVDVSLALSPGLNLVYSGQSELERLCEKFLKFAKRGVKTFCLFLDDIPETLTHECDNERFSSLADAQQYFTNSVYMRLKKEVKDLKFIMCPTLYFGEKPLDYHYELGEKILPEIEIMWTGPKVCSERLEVNDAKMISEVFRRPVLYWDNYPVNDSAMAPELHIGPYTGRSGELYKYSSGLVLNPMSMAYASFIVMNSVADYFEKKESFESVSSWKASIKKIVPECYEEFIDFAKANLKSPICLDSSAFVKKMMDEFKKLFDNYERVNAGELLIKMGKRICKNYYSIMKTVNNKLLGDIKTWLYEYNFWGETLIIIGKVVLVDVEMYRKDPSEEKLEEVTAMNKHLEKRLKEAVGFKTHVLGDEIFSFSLDRLKVSKGLVSMYRY